MKLVASLMLLGWMMAVGTLLVAEDTTVRMAIAIVGLGTSIAG